VNPATAVIISLVAYKITLVVMGLVARSRTRTGADFFLGGRRLGPVIAAVSASASSSSVWTLLGVSGAAYRWGLSAVWIFPACVGGFLLNWHVLAPALRRVSHGSGALTVTEILAGPPGRPLRGVLTVLASLIVLVSMTAYISFQFQGSGKTFSETFDISLSTSIVLGGGIVLIYTFLGGFWAVSLTDTLQGLMMAGASILLPLAALYQVGGPGGLRESLVELQLDGYLSLVQNAEKTGGVGFILGLLGIGLGYPGQPHVVNRFMALREGEAVLRRSRRIAILWAVIVYSGMLVLGLCGRVLCEELADHEAVFIRLANDLFHPLLAGLLLAAVLSAIMSTADSQLLVAASSITHDLGLGKNSRMSLLLRSRIIVVALCAGALALALLVDEKIFRGVLFAWTAMGAAFGPLLLVTILRGPVPPLRSLLAMSLGFGLSVAFHSIPDTRGAIERIVPFLVAFLVILVPPGYKDRMGGEGKK